MGVFENDFQTAGREYVTLKGSLARLLIDATHKKARKGGPCVGLSPVDRGKNDSKLTVLADEESVPLCAVFSAGNVSDTIHLPIILETARKQYGNLSQFGELLADKRKRCCCKSRRLSAAWPSAADIEAKTKKEPTCRGSKVRGSRSA